MPINTFGRARVRVRKHRERWRVVSRTQHNTNVVYAHARVHITYARRATADGMFNWNQLANKRV